MLIGIFGNMGAGKTLFMSIMCQWLNFKLRVPIYANYPLKNSIPIKTLDELTNVERGVVALDEFWVSMDSRQSEYNVLLSRWVNQTRKKNILVLYTTQAMSQVDKRVRNANHLLVFCEKFEKVDVPFYRYTFLSGSSGTILKSFKIPVAKAKNFYNFYDTFAVVFPLYAKSTKSNQYQNRKVSSYQKSAGNGRF